jgi:MSHA biogenesis protein MshJ
MSWWKNEYVSILISAYEKISVREQKIILLTVLSLLSLIVYVLAIEPLVFEYKALVIKSDSLIDESKSIKRQLKLTLEKKYQDPNVQLQKQIDKLENKSSSLDEKIGRLTKALVAPKQMVRLLENVLKSDRKMKLISFVNLPKEDVELVSEALSLDKSTGVEAQLNYDSDEGLIYKHAFEIEMKSTYESMVSYLQRIDKLPWKIFWQDLRYEAGEYPYGFLKIKIYTLSTSKEVLGV